MLRLVAVKNGELRTGNKINFISCARDKAYTEGNVVSSFVKDSHLAAEMFIFTLPV